MGASRIDRHQGIRHVCISGVVNVRTHGSLYMQVQIVVGEGLAAVGELVGGPLEMPVVAAFEDEMMLALEDAGDGTVLDLLAATLELALGILPVGTLVDAPSGPAEDAADDLPVDAPSGPVEDTADDVPVDAPGGPAEDTADDVPVDAPAGALVDQMVPALVGV